MYRIRIRAKSGCPVFGQSAVNSGHSSSTQYVLSGNLFSNDSRSLGSYVVRYSVFPDPRDLRSWALFSFVESVIDDSPFD